MSGISKISAFTLILIIVVSSQSLLVTKFASAQSVPKPLVPEFTVQYSENRTINIIRFIVITIKNQPFTPTMLSDNNYTELWYSFRVKEHSANWGPTVGVEGVNPQTAASNTNTTAITISLHDGSVHNYNYDVEYGTNCLSSITYGDTVDFQVEAFVGVKVTQYSDYTITHVVEYHGHLSDSNWSQTQTVTIPPAATPTTVPNLTIPTPAPAVPKTMLEISAVVVLSIICLSFGLALRRQRKTKLLQS